MKVKEIHITKSRMIGQSDYAQGVYYVLENGDVYEALSTDVLEHLTKSSVSYEDLLAIKE